MISTRQPFNQARNPEAQRFLQALHPGYGKLPHPSTLARRARDISKELIKEELSLIPEGTRPSLIVDGWSSPARKYSLFGIMLSFLDAEWRPHFVLVGLEMHNHRADGAYLEQLTARRVHDLQLKWPPLGVSADNGGHASAAGISTHLKRYDSGYQDMYQIPCLAHVLQLAEGIFYTSFNVPAAPEIAVEQPGLINNVLGNANGRAVLGSPKAAVIKVIYLAVG